MLHLGVVGVSLLDHKFLFLEYEVVTEPEDLQLEADSDGQIEEEQLKESEPPASDGKDTLGHTIHAAQPETALY